MADQFKPGNVYSAVVEALKESIKDALKADGTYDLQTDVSGSVSDIRQREQLLALVRERGNPRMMFVFADTLSRVEGAIQDCHLPVGGGTDTPGALKSYLDDEFEYGVQEVVVLTDQQGADQHKDSMVSIDRTPRITLMVYGEDGVPRSA